MKNVLAALIVFCVTFTNLFAQDKPVRPKALALSFVMNDFTTANRIRTGSLSRVFNEKAWADFNEMSPGLALTYFKGLTPYIDFAGTLAASYTDAALKNKPSSGDGLLLEGDVSGQFKMFEESYAVTPYVSAGLGLSKYRKYYGAFVPIGLGIKVNLFNEASIFVATQYRVPVIKETNNYHFMYSFGISGVIGK
jgi:OmpA-OmpF porin, OOP family